ncbi:hypothetical protein K501DRAFT_267846 [Backusella circina FSU 941]|nr:hypothetical protein K501DRAFT_267846 [Backusella circina FSU 941]
MSPVDRLLDEIVNNIKNTSDYIETLEKQAQHDNENVETHLTKYQEKVHQEQEQSIRLKDETQKEREGQQELKKKLSIGISKNPKLDPLYYESRHDLLVERIKIAKDELRFLKESKPESIILEDPEQERRDSIELDIYIKYTQLRIEQTCNDNELRFIFHALNQTKPSESYTVSLYISDKNEYKVTECSPYVQEIYQLSKELDKSRELYHFLARARQAFIKSIDQQ